MADVKMMLGFVVRRCAADLGHQPSPGELADWANNQEDSRGPYRVFGRPISTGEAQLIMKHPERLVAVRRNLAAVDAPPQSLSMSLAAASNVVELQQSRRKRM